MKGGKNWSQATTTLGGCVCVWGGGGDIYQTLHHVHTKTLTPYAVTETVVLSEWGAGTVQELLCV